MNDSLARANALYKEGNYQAAAQAYQNLLLERPGSADLHYNLASALFKLGEPGSLGRATAGYWRAFRINPRDADIRHNLDFALKRSGESLVPPGIPPALHVTFHSLSGPELLGLQWIGGWLSLLLASVALWRAASRVRLRPWLAAALLFWALGACWWGLRRLNDVPGPGVIAENNAEVRSGPGINFPVTFNAPEGRRVSVLEESGEWLEIGVLKEGLRGWARNKAIEKI
ncbi:MAG: SH3 domain-containing protein [Elusimicrobia bacterium]|nr:SH3 domain-containing protein [Elusimicrobiota bacterium]